VKVKRGLFSYPVEEHLPSQSARPWPVLAGSAQVLAGTATCLDRQSSRLHPLREMARAKTCTFLHIGCKHTTPLRRSRRRRRLTCAAGSGPGVRRNRRTRGL